MLIVPEYVAGIRLARVHSLEALCHQRSLRM